MNTLVNATKLAEPSKLDAQGFARKLIRNSIWKSANTEGLDLRLSTVEAVLDNEYTTTRMKDVLYILNQKKAWEFILDNLEYTNCFMLLRQLSKISSNYFLEENQLIRTFNVTIGGTSYEPPVLKESAICNAIEGIDLYRYPLDKALEFFCYIAKSHIFRDCNLSIAILMANKILIEHNIGVLSISVGQQLDFHILLAEFYESGNSVKLKTFLKEKCIDFI